MKYTKKLKPNYDRMNNLEKCLSNILGGLGFTYE
jgi:hypothetical protein